MYKKSIFWFREDLRLNDNIGLWNALKDSKEVICIYIFNKNETDSLGFNNVRQEFIWNSIKQLKLELKFLKSDLFIFHGTPENIIPQLIKKHSAEAVFTNEAYTPQKRQEEYSLNNSLSQLNVKLLSFKDFTIFSKNEILDKNKTPITNLTQYSKQWIKLLSPEHYFFYDTTPLTSNLSKLKQPTIFYPHEIKLKKSTKQTLGTSSNYALKVLEAFLKNKVSLYSDLHTIPAESHVSYLSAYLNQGLISIRQAVSYALHYGEKNTEAKEGCNMWINQLMLRDFYCQFIFHHPLVLLEPYHSRFEGFPWNNNMFYFQQWCNGNTGYPLVDAAMRHFNKNGYMHQSLRKLVSSFLTKHLLIDYRLGEKYFAEKSIDYHPIFNNSGWQWAASTGIESQSFYKIINPISFSEKYDNEAIFIKKHVPELRLVDKKYIHNPYKYRKELLTFGISLGHNYPTPIVENHSAREKAIWAFEQFNNF